MNLNGDARFPGSAPVSGAGDGVAPSRTFPDAKPREDALYFRRRLPHFERPWAIYAVTIGAKMRRCLSPDARWIWTQDDEFRVESSFRRDAESSTRDARATQSSEGNAR